MKRVLVTHPECFLSQHLIRELSNTDYTLRIAAEDEISAARAQKLADDTSTTVRFEIVQVDLERPQDIAIALDGCNVLFHTLVPGAPVHEKTADYPIHAKRDIAMRWILAARNEIGMQRVIVTSSTRAATGNGVYNRKTPFTEDDWALAPVADPYVIARAVTLAERALWDYFHSSTTGLQLTTLLTGGTIGPLISDEIPQRLRPMEKLVTRKYPGLPRAGIVLTDARDLALAQVASLQTEASAGQRIIVADRFYWLSEIASILRQHIPRLRKQVTSIALPDFVSWLASLANEEIKSIMSTLGRERHVSNAKLTSILGVTPRCGVETIVETVNSILQHQER